MSKKEALTAQDAFAALKAAKAKTRAAQILYSKDRTADREKLRVPLDEAREVERLAREAYRAARHPEPSHA